MVISRRSWSVREEFNKAKLQLEIPKFSEVVGNTGREVKISSKLFHVGRSKFRLAVYPGGVEETTEQGMFSVYLYNVSNHDVVVDFTISANWGMSMSKEDDKIEKNCDSGWADFMKTRDVGADLNLTVEVTMRWEDLSGGMVEEYQVNRSDLKQEIKNSEESLKQEMKNLKENMQQEMKSVRAEIARVKTSSIPECPVCFQKLAPPKKIVQCLKVGLQFVLGHIFPF